MVIVMLFIVSFTTFVPSYCIFGDCDLVRFMHSIHITNICLSYKWFIVIIYVSCLIFMFL